MRKTMRKIIIAYDGSPCAKAAINDLKNAGLPDEVEATIVSVADVWLPPDDQTTLDLLPDEPPTAVVAARNRAKEAIDQSLMRAVEGAQFVRQLFPNGSCARRIAAIHRRGHWSRRQKIGRQR